MSTSLAATVRKVHKRPEPDDAGPTGCSPAFKRAPGGDVETPVREKIVAVANDSKKQLTILGNWELVKILFILFIFWIPFDFLCHFLVTLWRKVSKR